MYDESISGHSLSLDKKRLVNIFYEYYIISPMCPIAGLGPGFVLHLACYLERSQNHAAIEVLGVPVLSCRASTLR